MGLTSRVWESVNFSTSLTSVPSSTNRVQCEYASLKSSCTMGLGGIVLANRRCSFVLKDSGTGVPSV